MKKLDLKALELAGMILCAIVDLAIIAAAVFLYIHTGHGAWMALIVVVFWSLGLFLPFEERKIIKEKDKALEEQKKKAEEKPRGQVVFNGKFVMDAEELWNCLGIKKHEDAEKEDEDPFFVPVDNGGATPI